MIDVEIDDPSWTRSGLNLGVLVRAAVAATLDEHEGEGGVAVQLTSDAAIHALNLRFRNQDKPTNVLAFPAVDNPEDHLGDVALAYGVCAVEAGAQGKALADHLQHLVTHGVLHLLGYDHETDAEAAEMEGLERQILAGLGIADPYGAERGDDGQF